MYVVSPKDVTPHTCFGLLSLLDSYNYDTTWIRSIWSGKGISDGWCAQRCIEIINREGIEIPTDYYGVRYIPETLDRVSSYYNEHETESTNTFPRY